MTIPLATLFAAAESLPKEARPIASLSANCFGIVVARVHWVGKRGEIRDAEVRKPRAEVTDDAAIQGMLDKVCAKVREEIDRA